MQLLSRAPLQDNNLGMNSQLLIQLQRITELARLAIIVATTGGPQPRTLSLTSPTDLRCQSGHSSPSLFLQPNMQRSILHAVASTFLATPPSHLHDDDDQPNTGTTTCRHRRNRALKHTRRQHNCFRDA